MWRLEDDESDLESGVLLPSQAIASLKCYTLNTRTWKKILTWNNWKRLVRRTGQRHLIQSNGVLRLCRYRQAGRSSGWSSNGSVVSRLRGVGISLGLYAAIARDGWKMQKKSGWTDECDGLDDRGSSDLKAWCWNKLDSIDTSDFDISWLLIEFSIACRIWCTTRPNINYLARGLHAGWSRDGWMMQMKSRYTLSPS